MRDKHPPLRTDVVGTFAGLGRVANEEITITGMMNTLRSLPRESAMGITGGSNESLIALAKPGTREFSVLGPRIDEFATQYVTASLPD
jgi:hypothetical protein